MDSLQGDRAARMACILHGRRPAMEKELECTACGTVMCAVCVTSLEFEDLCARCVETENERRYERQLAQAEEEDDWRREQDAKRTGQIRWALIGVIAACHNYLL